MVLDGKRPQDGWIVHTAGGDYQMNSSLGYGTPTIAVPVVTHSGDITMGGLSNGVTTMLDGTRPIEGSYVITPNGDIYLMGKDKGVLFAAGLIGGKKSTDTITDSTVLTPPTPTKGVKSFVLVDPNMWRYWSANNHAVNVVRVLKQVFGSNVDVISTEGWTGDIFVNWWNNYLPNDIDSIVIYGHGKSKVQGVDESILQPIRIAHVELLNSKNVKMLLLMGCNTGHLDKIGENLASAFVDKVGPNGTVVAPDGSVGYFPSPVHTIMNTDYFKDNRPEVSTRKPTGFVVYM